MSGVVLPRLDRESIKRISRELAPAYLLYHPGKNWFAAQYGGSFYYFPPDLGGVLVDHPQLREASGEPKQVPADGILAVRDRYGIIYEEKATAKWGYARGIKEANAKIDEETADKVVTFFTGKYGEGAESPLMTLGIVLLTGDPKIDAQIKLLSKEMANKARLSWANQERETRLTELDKWKKLNPNRTDYPPMNPRQIEAEEILLTFEVGRSASKYAYVCECGGFESNDTALFMQHQKVRHPEAVKQAVAVVENVLPAEPVKRGRGRPRKNPLPIASGG